MFVAGRDDVLEFLFALSWTFSQFTSIVLNVKTCLMPASYFIQLFMILWNVHFSDGL